MKIVRAMKQIARLKGEVQQLKHRIESCLSTVVENEEFNENMPNLTDELDKKITKIVNLKAGVMHANVKHNMFEKILNLGELKSYIEYLKELQPKSGFVVEPYEKEKIEYKSQFTIAEKNEKIKECQRLINDLTDDLDEFNAKTDILELDVAVWLTS